MPPRRLVRAAAVLVLLVLATGLLPGPASAGVPAYEVGTAPICELGAGGPFTVVVTFTNLLDVETQVVDVQFAFITGASTIFSGTTAFDPELVGPGETTVAQFTGPGDSVYVEVGFFITALDRSATTSHELDPGPCQATTTTTAGSPIASPLASPIPVAEVVQPRFTG